MLVKYPKQNLGDEMLFEILYSKFAIKTATIDNISKQLDFKESHLDEIADEILANLNETRRIMVFICTAPIYSIPLVAINPAEAKNSRLYALLDGEDQETHVYKYPSEEIVLWRLFVWDRIKSTKFEGISILYLSKI